MLSSVAAMAAAMAAEADVTTTLGAWGDRWVCSRQHTWLLMTE